MQPGEDWRLVFAKTVDGLSEHQCEILGAQYKQAVDSGNPDAFSWTNPTTGETFTGLAAKANALATGRDSVLAVASKIFYVFRLKYSYYHGELYNKIITI